MLLDLIFLAVGIFLLVKGADLLIDGSSNIARRFGIPEFVIGLTLVAFGTSLPEFTVNVAASIKRASEISLGNVVGSNIANILLILGISALINPISVHATFVKKEIPVNLFITLTLIAMANDVLLNHSPISQISRSEGIVLILTFVGYMYFLVAYLEKLEVSDEDRDRLMHPVKAVIFTVLGLAGLILGAELTVDGAVNLAKALGVSEAVIGLFLVAVGTSLPELFASAVAAKKGNPDIALGNVAGSNIFNATLVLGTSAIINPIPVPDRANYDFLVLFVATLLLVISYFTGRKYTIDRKEGLAFLILYFAYALFSWYSELR